VPFTVVVGPGVQSSAVVMWCWCRRVPVVRGRSSVSRWAIAPPIHPASRCSQPWRVSWSCSGVLGGPRRHVFVLHYAVFPVWRWVGVNYDVAGLWKHDGMYLTAIPLHGSPASLRTLLVPVHSLRWGGRVCAAVLRRG
jgi:hypothetical protein